ncbi:DUF6192 family protein [Streptomyces sp. NPDC087263]|uniref:DUF6192 family protein n=1 Tax=Streptomyces sp. NPDC087263 TaxID=3365773 RepID=UPI00380E4508
MRARPLGQGAAPQEKVSAIHTLAQDEEVAATVTSDLLRRPTVIAQVKQDLQIPSPSPLPRRP